MTPLYDDVRHVLKQVSLTATRLIIRMNGKVGRYFQLQLAIRNEFPALHPRNVGENKSTTGKTCNSHWRIPSPIRSQCSNISFAIQLFLPAVSTFNLKYASQPSKLIPRQNVVITKRHSDR
jgi:hypothetical protein